MNFKPKYVVAVKGDIILRTSGASLCHTVKNMMYYMPDDIPKSTINNKIQVNSSVFCLKNRNKYVAISM